MCAGMSDFGLIRYRPSELLLANGYYKSGANEYFQYPHWEEVDYRNYISPDVN